VIFHKEGVRKGEGTKERKKIKAREEVDLRRARRGVQEA